MLLKIQSAVKELKRATEIFRESGKEDLKVYINSFCIYVKMTQRPFGFGYSFLDYEVKNESD